MANSSTTTTFPIIDVSEIDNPSRQLKIAQEVTTACSQWGFLLIKGHPIPTSEIKEMFALSKTFFSLPEEDKEPWPINSDNIGYIGSLKDRSRDDKMSMWFGGTPGSLNKKEALPPYWHEHTEKIEAFKHKCHGLVIKLLVAFALAMDLPDRNFFADAHLENVGKGNSLRMLMYPARGEMPETTGSRMQPHTDSGSVTLLFQQGPGLEVLGPEGDWVKAPCLEDCILINLGDALSFWSGTKLKATLHRVTFDGVRFDQERQSMAYFGQANPQTVLQPLHKGVMMETYKSNGLELKPGITVGQLSDLIMSGIYGKSVLKDSNVAVTV